MYQYKNCVLLSQLDHPWPVVGDLGKSALWLSLRPPGRTIQRSVLVGFSKLMPGQMFIVASTKLLCSREPTLVITWKQLFCNYIWRFFFWYPLKHKIFRRDKASSSLMPKSCRLVWDVVVWKRATPLNGQCVGTIMIPQRIFRPQIGFGWKRKKPEMQWLILMFTW